MLVRTEVFHKLHNTSTFRLQWKKLIQCCYVLRTFKKIFFFFLCNICVILKDTISFTVVLLDERNR